MNQDDLLKDPVFQRLLRRRSRLRWGLSGLLVSVYLIYGMAGLYAAEFLAAPISGSATTWGILLGYSIILLGIASSIFYVRQVNRIIAPLQNRVAGQYGGDGH